MADHAARHEAEALLTLAEATLAGIESEIAALELARRTAREALERVESTAAASVALAGWFGEQLREGRQLQDETSKAFARDAVLQQELGKWRLEISSRTAPPIIALSIQPTALHHLAPARLPVFAAPDRETLWQGKLPRMAHPQLWDALAAEITTFEDARKEALARVAAAERELKRAAETKGTRHIQAGGPRREEQDHER